MVSYRFPNHSQNQSAKQIDFYWHGKKLRALEGEKLSTALLANGVRVVGRSFKYGRGRGILAYGVEEPNAFVTLEPNTLNQRSTVKATEVHVYAGMRVISATAYPFLYFDWRQLFKPVHWLISVGFYKNFSFVKGLQTLYSKTIHELARIFQNQEKLEDKDDYLRQSLCADVLIIGAGISGCQMALELSKSTRDLRVILCEKSTCLGGETLAEIAQDSHAQETLQTLIREVEQQKNIHVLTQSTVFNLDEDGVSFAWQNIQSTLPIEERKEKAVRKLLHIRTDKVVLATGTFERPILFKNNDLPGVMLASAVRRYLVNDGVLFASYPVLIGNNDSIYHLAKDLCMWDVKPKIVDLRQEKDITKYWITYCQENTIMHYKGYAPIVAHALGSGASSQVCDIEIAPVECYQTSTGSFEWLVTGDAEKILTDGIAVSGGFDPVLHLSIHCGGQSTFNSVRQSYLPVEEKIAEKGLIYCGSVCGLASWQACLEDSKLKSKKILSGKKVNNKKSAWQSIPPIFNLPYQKNVFVDLQMDVKISDIALSIQEGCYSMKDIQQYTAIGMGMDQGKTSIFNAIAVAASIFRQPIEKFSSTILSSSYIDSSFGLVASSHQHLLVDARRYTPIYSAHLPHHPVWELVGQYYQPRYYVQGKESMQEAIERECSAVRTHLAMMDVSTLSKIEIHGRDARNFLSQILSNSWLSLLVGHGCYDPMGDKKNMFGEGVVNICINEEYFYMSMTTVDATDRVYKWMQLRRQTEFQDLDIVINNVTEKWVSVAITGAKSREFIQSVDSDIDFSNEAFSPMQWCEGKWGDFEVRIMCMGLSGLLSFEVSVLTDKGLKLWQSIEQLSAEKGYHLTPYGTESMRILRAEKTHC